VAIADSCALFPGFSRYAGDMGDGVDGSMRRFGFDVRISRGSVDDDLSAEGGAGVYMRIG
jgi:hypothetical protein